MKYILFIFMFSCNSITHDPTMCDSIRYYDSIIFSDSVIIHDSVSVRDSILRDSLKIIDIGNGNLIIRGNKEHTTFNIDLDSIQVVIRNDSIISYDKN